MMIEPQVMYQKIKVMCCASAICSVSCTLFVQLESSPLSSAVFIMQIKVKTLTGKEIEFDIEPTGTPLLLPKNYVRMQ